MTPVIRPLRSDLRTLNKSPNTILSESLIAFYGIDLGGVEDRTTQRDERTVSSSPHGVFLPDRSE